MSKIPPKAGLCPFNNQCPAKNPPANPVPNPVTRTPSAIDFLSEQKYNRLLIRRVGRHLKFDSLDPAQLTAWGLTIKSFLALCTLERIRILKFGKGGELGRTILETLKEMNPDEDL